MKKIDKTKTIVENEYIWLSISDNETMDMLDNVNISIDGVLQLDEWDDAFIEFINVNNIYGLELKGSKYENTKFSLSILKSLPKLKYLRILGKYKKMEYKFIESLENLEQLSLGDYEAYELDFSKLKNLKSYFSPIKHYDHPIFDCKNIEFFGTNTNLENIEPIGKLTKIKELYLFSKKLKDLKGIEKLENLQLLKIDYGHNLQDISVLSKLNKLDTLSLYACKKLENLNAISKIKNLRWLQFDECGTIESLCPLMHNQHLEYIAFGDTIVEDGNIECLTKIKTLKKVFFRNKRHYNLKLDYFKT